MGNSIESRLGNIAPYHPFEAETFADWSLEAGDLVTVSRDGSSYRAPVHSATLRWNGRQKITLRSNGSEERESVSKTSQKRYATRGLSGAMRNQQALYWELWAEDGRLHAALKLNNSLLALKMEDLYNGLKGYLEFTAYHLYVEFEGKNDGLRSEFELTRSRLYLHFEGLYDGLYSELEFTRSRLYIHFWGLYDGLSSELELTRSRLWIAFNGLYDGLHSELELTRSRLRLEFYSLYDGLHSELEITRSRLYMHFWGIYDGLSSELELTRSRMWIAFNGMYDGLHSELEMTRSRLRVEFYGLYDGLNSSLEMTRSQLRVEFQGLYDGLNSSLSMTRSQLRIEFKGLYDGLSSNLEMTRSRLTVTFNNAYDGMNSMFSVTSSNLLTWFHDYYRGLNSSLELTSSALQTTFDNYYEGLSSSFGITSSNLLAQFNNYYGGLSSAFEVTSSNLAAQFNSYYTGMTSSFSISSSGLLTQFDNYYKGMKTDLSVTASSFNVTVQNYYTGLKSYIDQTASSISLGADKIHITAYSNLTLSDILTIDTSGSDSIVRFKTTKLRVGTSPSNLVTLTDGVWTANEYKYKDSSDSSVKSCLKDASVDVNTNTLTITRFDGTSVTFSKAATTKVSGSWSSGILTVSADANGEDQYKIILDHKASKDVWDNNEKGVTAYIDTQKYNGSGQQATALDDNVKSIWINTSRSYNAGLDYGLLHNVTFTASDDSGTLQYGDSVSVVASGTLSDNSPVSLGARYYTVPTPSVTANWGKSSSTLTYDNQYIPKLDGTAVSGLTITFVADYAVHTDGDKYVVYAKTSDGTIHARTTTGTDVYDNGVDAGWLAYFNAWHYPTAISSSDTNSPDIVVEHPGSTQESADVSKTFTLAYANGYATVSSGDDVYARIPVSSSSDCNPTIEDLTLSPDGDPGQEYWSVAVNAGTSDKWYTFYAECGNTRKPYKLLVVAPSTTHTPYVNHWNYEGTSDPGRGYTQLSATAGFSDKWYTFDATCGGEETAYKLLVEAPTISSSDIGFKSSYFGDYSASALSGHSLAPSSITLTHETGYYTMVIDYPGNSAGKWYQVYIDGSSIAGGGTVSIYPSSNQQINPGGSITVTAQKNGTDVAAINVRARSVWLESTSSAAASNTILGANQFYRFVYRDEYGNIEATDTTHTWQTQSSGGSSGPTNHTGFYITVTQSASGKTVTASVTYPLSSSIPSGLNKNGQTVQLYWY